MLRPSAAILDWDWHPPQDMSELERECAAVERVAPRMLPGPTAQKECTRAAKAGLTPSIRQKVAIVEVTASEQFVDDLLGKLLSPIVLQPRGENRSG